MNPSLQRRLAMGSIILLLPLFFGLWLLLSMASQQIYTDYIVSRLQHDVDALLTAIRLHKQGVAQPYLATGHLDPIYLRPWSGHYFHIRINENSFRSRSLWDTDLPLPPFLEGQEQVLTLSGPRQEPLLTFTRHLSRQGFAITILVAEEIRDQQSLLATTRLWYGLIALLTLMLLLLLQREMVKRALAPLTQAKEEIRLLEQGELPALSTHSVPIEILPFVSEINLLLSTLEQRLRRFREVGSNLAHAIKTPLAIMMQWLASSELDHHPQLRQQLQQQIEAIRAWTDRVLKRARFAGSTSSTTWLDLPMEVHSLVGLLRQMYRQRHIDIQLQSADHLFVHMDREDALEMIGNLLDNACKWASTRVLCRLIRQNGLLICIEDDGPGCSAEQYEQILNRGIRFDPSTPGHGIGLALVQEIVLVYKGILQVGVSQELGGLQVTIQLEERYLSSTE
ncbi:sensor histidine kinase [Candidatus Magnetaquicoccus inordinatus]|uniref:sensor histidine kinase n=1 Tax=Candidatus Magnetaquicoccus inordinatus TaxID=2496818 RepID=UPI00102B637B|nr:sensor histidine kinase [Candidatus Magnetaquicoccus inordinatus]